MLIKNLLDVLSKVNKTILIITNKYNNEDYKKYKSQYNNVNIKISNSFHDRFIIIDDKNLYHCGASFKDLGKKCFGINKIEDKKILSDLLTKINLIKQLKDFKRNVINLKRQNLKKLSFFIIYNKRLISEK